MITSLLHSDLFLHVSTSSSHIFLLREREKHIVNDICETEETKKKQILKWAEILEERIYLNDLQIQLNQISSYISKELRARGWTNGQLAYLYEFMPRKYVNENLSRNEKGQVTLSDLSFEDSIYYEYEKVTENINNDNDIKKLSLAEIIEYYNKVANLEKEIKNRMSGKRNLIINYCERTGLSIPQLEKQSADSPPEYFHGQSKLWKSVKNMSERIFRVHKRFDRVADIVYEFKPTEEIAQKASEQLEEYQTKIIDPFEKMVILLTKGIEDIIRMPDDSKYGAPAQDWIHIALDKYASYGSHGSGKIHAVPTGIYAMKIGKDGKSVVITQVKREFTREIVGDRSAKDLLLKAHNYLQLQNVEQFIQIWSKNTVFEEIVKDPREFFEEENKKIQHPQQEIVLKEGGASIKNE